MHTFACFLTYKDNQFSSNSKIQINERLLKSLFMFTFIIQTPALPPPSKEDWLKQIFFFKTELKIEVLPKMSLPLGSCPKFWGREKREKHTYPTNKRELYMPYLHNALHKSTYQVWRSGNQNWATNHKWSWVIILWFNHKISRVMTHV